MKQTNKWQRKNPLVPTPTTVNYEGFPAYERPLDEQIVQVLCAGSPTNTFYMGKDEVIDQAVDTLSKCESPEFLAKALIYAREFGYTRSMPILGLAMLSTKNMEIFHRVAPQVCRNAHDWQNFIDLCRSGRVRKGLGSGIKKEIIRAMPGMQIYQAVKYPEAVLNMVNIARPHERVNRPLIKYAKEGMKAGTHGEKMLEAIKRAQDAETPLECAKAIVEGNLPYEAVSGFIGKFGKEGQGELWNALVYTAPHFNMVRNLASYARHGILDRPETVEYIKRELVNERKIEKAHLFPFRYYIAYRTLEGEKRNFFSWEEKPKASKELKAFGPSLEAAIELSCKNVPSIGGRIAIMPDISTSMDTNLLGDEGVLQCIDAAAIFSAILRFKCEQTPLILPFESQVRFDYAKKMLDAKTVFDCAKALETTGGTSLSAPIRYLLDKKIAVDTVIGFTDNVEWVGNGFLETFLKYRQVVNKRAKAYLVTLMPYQAVPVPPSIEDVYFIYGWSDNILRAVTTDPEEQMKMVRAMEY